MEGSWKKRGNNVRKIERVKEKRKREMKERNPSWHPSAHKENTLNQTGELGGLRAAMFLRLLPHPLLVTFSKKTLFEVGSQTPQACESFSCKMSPKVNAIPKVRFALQFRPVREVTQLPGSSAFFKSRVFNSQINVHRDPAQLHSDTQWLC